MLKTQKFSHRYIYILFLLSCDYFIKMKENISSLYGLDDTNILFITLDCCRYDTLMQANAPFIKQIGPVQRARTHGTYTLPAHMSFFMGYLPICVDDVHQPYYSNEVRQLWRLRSGREKNLQSVGIMLDGKNIIEGYRNLGFKTVGTGGVRWFRNQTLTDLFDEFYFFGPDDKASVFTRRKKEHFSLNNIPKVLEAINNIQKYFLFVNCLETHVPYDFGEGRYSQEIEEIIQKASSIWGCKKGNLDQTNVTKEELSKLHNAQVKAVESLDSKVKALVDQLPKKLLIVACGDHGECFGEDMNWGHGYATEKILEVPLVIGEIIK